MAENQEKGEDGQKAEEKNGGVGDGLRHNVEAAISAVKEGGKIFGAVVGEVVESARPTIKAVKSAAEQYFTRKKAEESPKDQSKFAELSSAIRGYKAFLITEAGFSPEEADQAVQDRVGDILNGNPNQGRKRL